MIIKYGCATLRAIEDSDFELLFSMMNSPEIQYQHKMNQYPVNSGEQREWMKRFHNSDKCLRFVIELSNGASIGLVSLYDIDLRNGTAHLKYKVTPTGEGRMKGDVYDAVYGLLQYAFKWLRLNCIEGRFIETNYMSRKLAKKLGFKEEGLMRKRVFADGEYHNIIPASVLKEDFFDDND